MTLIIASKRKNRITLSSDSRISYPLGQVDFGIKIFSVPVQIFSPTSSETNVTTLDYDHTLGLGVSGSAIAAYLIKDSVIEILQHLQYSPLHTDFSMNGIAQLVFKVYNKMTKDIDRIPGVAGKCELILGGFCPRENQIRLFKFHSAGTGEPLVEEILQDLGNECLGSGTDAAMTLYRANPNLHPLYVVREVVKDTTVPTVGGGLQYGEFVDSNFRIYGVEDYELEQDGTFKNYVQTLRGLSIYKDEFQQGDEDFLIFYRFVRPFQGEVDELFKKMLDD